MKKIVYLLDNNTAKRIELNNYLLSIFGNSFEIIQFNNFEECILHNQIPDLIIANQTIDANKAMNIFKAMFNDVEFIFFTNQDSISNAISLIENGAFDYIINQTNISSEIEYNSLEILKRSITQLFSNTLRYLSPLQKQQTLYFQ
jgi:DNA-binding NtrC family response regulator